jgi:Major Facilitator Superfamily
MWLQAWPYWPALRHPALRRLLPGYAISALGDGMSVVAVAWLALRLTPPSSQGLWVGASIAAFTLPGALGVAAFGRWLRGHRGVRLAGADAALRAVALGAVSVLALAHLLTPPTYVLLLGLSSLLHAWGMAGQYMLIAEILPPQHRVAGNALLGITNGITLIGGPALAGLLAAVAGPAPVIAIDAATYAVLAMSYAWAAPFTLPPGPPRETKTPAPAGWRIVRANPTLAGLLALTFVFYAIYGPVEVALPVHVERGLHGSAALLGAFWAANAAGAVLGSLATPHLRSLRVWPSMIGIVAGWGLALLPVGLGASVPVSLMAFAAGGIIFAPYPSLSVALFQDASPPGALGSVLAVRSTLIIVSTPLGSALGGPVVALLGGPGTLLASALTTVALAAVAAVLAGPFGAPRTRRAARRAEIFGMALVRHRRWAVNDGNGAGRNSRVSRPAGDPRVKAPPPGRAR